MKAIILAAGYATRLHPLTLDKPKPLLEVNGIPIMDHILKRLEPLALETIYVVTNNKFVSHFEQWAQGKTQVVIVNDQTMTNEDRLGPIGDMAYVINDQKVDDDLLILAGDNLFDFDLVSFVESFNQHQAFTIGLIDLQTKEAVANRFGCAELNDASQIISFEEKPEHPKSTLGATLMYLIPRTDALKILEFFEKTGTSDAGNIITWLIETQKVFGHTFKEPWFDIGTLEHLKEAENYFKNKE